MPDYVRLPSTPEEKSARENARAAGERLFRAGKVAAVTVAGGQGTRLGFDAPKGTFPIGPVSGRSLFQIHAERILATRRRCGGALPWYIMTSDATDQPTKDFFEKHAWFGLPREDVRFFRQRMIPALDRNLRLVLVAKDQILLSPNGHGGTLTALAESGMLDDMERRGVKEISYFHVDNALAPAADPVFVGSHSLAGAEMSCKALWKREPEEPLGAFVRVADAGATGVAARRPRIQRPHPRADARADRRRAASLRPRQHRHPRPPRGLRPARDAARVQAAVPPGGEKFAVPRRIRRARAAEGQERLQVRDVHLRRVARRAPLVVLEVRREEEFSPLKNADGKDSPETARRDMSALCAGWLEQAGVRVPRDERGAPKHPIEISPLFALDAAELAGKSPGTWTSAGPILLAPKG